MEDLIGRAEAIDALYIPDYENGEAYSQYVNDKRAIELLPPAQPEIIKCKDCKHWLDIDDGRQKHRMCADIYGDWFCADAERRTDE